MSQTKCISANDIKNSNTIALGAGNTNANLLATITLGQNATQQGNINDPDDNGVVFGGNDVGDVVNSMTLAQRQAHFNIPAHWTGYDRRDVTIDLESGVVSNGSNNGVTVLPSGQNNVTGLYADKAFEGHFTFNIGAVPQNYVFSNRQRSYVETYHTVNLTGASVFSFGGSAAIVAA